MAKRRKNRRKRRYNRDRPIEKLTLEGLIDILKVPASSGASAIVTNPLWAYLTTRKIKSAQDHGIAAANVLQVMKSNNYHKKVLQCLENIPLNLKMFDEWDEMLEDSGHDRNINLFEFVDWLKVQPFHIQLKYFQTETRKDGNGYALPFKLARMMRDRGLVNKLGIRGNPGEVALRELILRPALRNYLEQKTLSIPWIGEPGSTDDKLMKYNKFIEGINYPIQNNTHDLILADAQKAPLILIDHGVRESIDRELTRHIVGSRPTTHYQMFVNVLGRMVGEQEALSKASNNEKLEQAYNVTLSYMQLTEAYELHQDKDDLELARRERSRAKKLWKDLHGNIDLERPLRVVTSGHILDEISTHEVRAYTPQRTVSWIMPIVYDKPWKATMVAEITDYLAKQGYKHPIKVGILYEADNESVKLSPAVSGPKLYGLMQKAEHIMLNPDSYKPREVELVEKLQKNIIRVVIDKAATVETLVDSMEHEHVGAQPVHFTNRMNTSLEKAKTYFDIDLSQEEIDDFKRGSSLFDRVLNCEPFMRCKRDPNFRHYIIPMDPPIGEDVLSQNFDVVQIAKDYDYNRLNEEIKELDLEKLHYKSHAAEGFVQIVEHPVAQHPEQSALMYHYLLRSLDPLAADSDASRIINNTMRANFSYNEARSVLELNGVDVDDFIRDVRWMSAYRNFYRAISKVEMHITGHLQRAAKAKNGMDREANKLSTRVKSEYSAIDFTDLEISRANINHILESYSPTIIGGPMREQMLRYVQDVRLIDEYREQIRDRLQTAQTSMAELMHTESQEVQNILTGVMNVYSKILGAPIKIDKLQREAYSNAA